MSQGAPLSSIPENIKLICEEIDHLLPPELPDEDRCCGRGCVPCIYDYYRENLKNWKASIIKKIELSNLDDKSKNAYLEKLNHFLRHSD